MDFVRRPESFDVVAGSNLFGDLLTDLSAVVSGAPIPISIHVDPDLDVSTDVAETVYFVANEAIANVLKHAGARVASVHVTKVAANVRVTVHDDGIGGVDADGNVMLRADGYQTNPCGGFNNFSGDDPVAAADRVASQVTTIVNGPN